MHLLGDGEDVIVARVLKGVAPVCCPMIPLPPIVLCADEIWTATTKQEEPGPNPGVGRVDMHQFDSPSAQERLQSSDPSKAPATVQAVHRQVCFLEISHMGILPGEEIGDLV